MSNEKEFIDVAIKSTGKELANQKEISIRFRVSKELADVLGIKYKKYITTLKPPKGDPIVIETKPKWFESFEKSNNERFDNFEKSNNKRFDNFEKSNNERFESVEKNIRELMELQKKSIISNNENFEKIDKRFDRLENLPTIKSELKSN